MFQPRESRGENDEACISCVPYGSAPRFCLRTVARCTVSLSAWRTQRQGASGVHRTYRPMTARSPLQAELMMLPESEPNRSAPAPSRMPGRCRFTCSIRSSHGASGKPGAVQGLGRRQGSFGIEKLIGPGDPRGCRDPDETMCVPALLRNHWIVSRRRSRHEMPLNEVI